MHSSAAMGKSLTLWMSSNSHLPAANSKIKSTSIQLTEIENIVEIQREAYQTSQVLDEIGICGGGHGIPTKVGNGLIWLRPLA